MGICWNVAIGSNNEFIRIEPSFALANGGLCSGSINRTVYSLTLNKVYILSDNHTITTVDCGIACETASYSGLTDLECKNSLPSSALTAVTISATLVDLAEPLVPALSAQHIPVVTGVRLLVPFYPSRMYSVLSILLTSPIRRSPVRLCFLRDCRKSISSPTLLSVLPITIKFLFLSFFIDRLLWLPVMAFLFSL